MFYSGCLHFICMYLLNFFWWYSIIGAVIVIIGLYLLLWGKEADQKMQIIPNCSPDVTSESDEDSVEGGKLTLAMKEEP